MPSQAKVQPDELISVLKEYSNEIIPNISVPSSVFWVNISTKLKKLMTPKAIYTFVRSNSHNCLNILCDEKF